MDKIKAQLISADTLSDVQSACQMTRSMGKFDNPADIAKKEKWDMTKINKMLELPHSKIARFTEFKFIITGASRRFLSQIITHHIGCDIMSGSIQYANLTKNVIPSREMFVVPYDILCNHDNTIKDAYIEHCKQSLEMYASLVSNSIDTDAAGYVMPMCVRNNILIKVNLEELIFIANQRLCRRNTNETRYVVGLMVEKVIEKTGLLDKFFMPTCVERPCQEGKYSCGCPVGFDTVHELLDWDFRTLRCVKK